MRSSTSFDQVTHKNGLNHSYAYFDRDIDTLSKSLATRDEMKFYITGNPNTLIEDSTRQETGISTINGQTVIELPAISSADTSPPSTRIKEQLDHLQTLIDEREACSNGFPENPHPIKILAPYKLGTSFHWNVLEIIIKTPTDLATCKSYDTDGSSHSIENAIFQNIQEGLQGHCSSAENQQESKKEYEKGFQYGNNCGLVSALVMHDLKRGSDRNYDGRINGEGFPESEGLRQYAYSLVQDHGEDAQRNSFCKPLSERGFTNNQLALENENPDTKVRNDIRSQLTNLKLSVNQIKILEQCKARGDNTAEKLKLLRSQDNATELSSILPILFTQEQGDYRIKEHALDAIDFALEDLSKSKTLIPDTDSNLESAISSLLLYVSDHGNKPLDSKESTDYFSMLGATLHAKDIQEFNEFSQTIKVSHQEKVERNEKASKPPAVDKKEKPLGEFSELETIILENANNSSPDLAALKRMIKSHDANQLSSIDKAKPLTREFLEPRTYGGIGAEIGISYNETNKRFEFLVKEVFNHGLAAELGLEIGNKITYKSEENSNETLAEALLAIRQIALKEPGKANELGSNIGLITPFDPMGRENSHDFVKFARDSSSARNSPLIHDKKVCSRPADLIAAIKRTTEIEPLFSRKPSPSPKRPSSPTAQKGNMAKTGGREGMVIGG